MTSIICSKYKLKRAINEWYWINPDGLCNTIIKGRNRSFFIYILNGFRSYFDLVSIVIIKYILHYGFNKQIKTWIINSRINYIRFRHVKFISILKKLTKISPKNDIDCRKEFCEYLLYGNFKMARLFYNNNIIMDLSYGSGFVPDGRTLHIPDKEKNIIITCEEYDWKNYVITLKEESFAFGDKLKYKISNTINLKLIGKNRHRLSEWFAYTNVGNRPIAREFLKI